MHKPLTLTVLAVLALFHAADKADAIVSLAVDTETYGSTQHLFVNAGFGLGSVMNVEIAYDSDNDQLIITEFYNRWYQRVDVPNGSIVINLSQYRWSHVVIRDIPPFMLREHIYITADTVSMSGVIGLEGVYIYNAIRAELDTCFIGRLYVNSVRSTIEDCMFDDVVISGYVRPMYGNNYHTINRVNVANGVYIYGTHLRDSITLNAVRRVSPSKVPEIKIYTYASNDWVSVKDSHARNFYVHGGSSSDTVKSEGGNGFSIRKGVNTSSVEYVK